MLPYHITSPKISWSHSWNPPGKLSVVLPLPLFVLLNSLLWTLETILCSSLDASPETILYARQNEQLHATLSSTYIVLLIKSKGSSSLSSSGWMLGVALLDLLPRKGLGLAVGGWKPLNELLPPYAFPVAASVLFIGWEGCWWPKISPKPPSPCDWNGTWPDG